MKKDEIQELSGLTSDAFIVCVDSIMDILVSTWKFGYFEEDDIRQEGHIVAIKAIRSGRYDKTKNLRSFLYTCLYNGLFNLKRNVTGRFASPCERCPLYDKQYKASHNQCLGFTNKADCKKFSAWVDRNAIRSSIINATPFSVCEVDHEDITPVDVVLDELTKNEITELINQKLSPHLRGIFLRMMAGITVKVDERRKVQDAIYDIIKDSGHFTHLLENLEYGQECT